MYTHAAVRRVKVDEAEVDLMARQPPPVVEAEDDLVLHEAGVDGGHALFQLLVQLQLHPHADEDGGGIHH